jgi:hypothetical protein
MHLYTYIEQLANENRELLTSMTASKTLIQ